MLYSSELKIFEGILIKDLIDVSWQVSFFLLKKRSHKALKLSSELSIGQLT
jgi:hypothetical protein